MIKRLVPYLAMIVCNPICFSSVTDVPETADGYLNAGEYAALSVTLEGDEELFVTGGGAFRISVEDQGYVEVQSTSIPLGIDIGGIMDITLYDNGDLLYLGGITDEITVRDDAEAVLKGGMINGITIYHLSSWSSKVTIYCQEGYQKDSSGISGLWADGTAFDIDFVNVGGVFSSYPTADYVNIVVIPEPATLALLGLGGLLIRRKK